MSLVNAEKENLISAKEARELSNNYPIQEKIRKLIRSIDIKIKESAKKGDTSCFYPDRDLFEGSDYASQKVLRQLIDQGYQIEAGLGGITITTTDRYGNVENHRQGINIFWK